MKFSPRSFRFSNVFLLSFAGIIMSSLITGCAIGTDPTNLAIAGRALQGKVRGGQQPVVGAHVYLMAATVSGVGSAGYGNPSTSLLGASFTGQSDSLGAYVLTDGNGSFSLDTVSGGTVAAYTCPSASTQVYLYALGGNPGAGTNPGSGFLAALGSCGNLSSTNFFWMNEVTTVAAAYALSGFAVDATHVSIPQFSSGTTPDTLAQTGLQNAFAVANNLVNPATGVALSTTPSGNGIPNVQRVYTLSNILASCVNSNGAIAGPSNPSSCYTLFNNALSGGSTGNIPTDTATAAISIAHHPFVSSAVVANLYSLQPAAGAPFAGGESQQSNDFSVAISYVIPNGTASVAVDASGNIWVESTTSGGTPALAKLSNTGVVLSGGGYTGGGYAGSSSSVPNSLAIDSSGNAWVTSSANNTINEFSSTGVPLSGTGFTGGGLSSPLGIAIDGSGNVWTESYKNNSLSKFSSAGAPISSTGYTGGGLNQPESIAIDGSGDVWAVNAGYNANSLSKFSNTGAPASQSAYTGGGLSTPEGIAIDSSGNVWSANYTGKTGSSPAINGNSISEFSNAGAPLSGTGYTGGLSGPLAIAIDGAGNAWAPDGYVISGGVTSLSNAGVASSPAGGYPAYYVGSPLELMDSYAALNSIAIDGSGNVWSTSGGLPGLFELVGAAVPVITPICAGLPANRTGNGTSNLGTRP